MCTFTVVFLCSMCDQEVKPRQRDLQCDACDNWQHRLCNTGKLHYQTIYYILNVS